MKHKVYQRQNGGYALINNVALSMLLKHCQNLGQVEAGGILLGNYRGSHIEVVFATPPGPGDLRFPFSFHRKCASHQRSATMQWVQSNRITTYIGEWHTHPQNSPLPSATDYTEWRKNLPSRDMLLCIQGATDLWVGEYSVASGKMQEIFELE